MNSSQIFTSALALGLVLAVPPATAQEEPAGRFDERIQVTEVLLDVMVTDADGNVVVGLGEQDFVVEEDGRPVTIGSATFYGSARLLESAAMADRVGGVGSSNSDRFFVLFFHDLRRELPALMRQQREAALQARRWIQESLGESDWVAVVSYYAKLRVHQDFTRDREDLLAAVDEVARGGDPGATWTAAAQLGDQPSLTRYLPQGKELRKKTTRVLDALKLLGEAAGNTRGRKNLLFFSIGFGDIDRFGWRPDPRYYPPAKQALNDGNVAVYPISLAAGTFPRDAVIEALSHSLTQLGLDTGGHDYQIFANFAVPLKQVAEDNGGYYLLSYSAEYPAGDSGYREVSVTTTNPNLRVRARDGYLFGG